MNNILSEAYLDTCSSGIGLTLNEFSLSEIANIRDGSLSKTISSGECVALDAEFGTDLLCNEARIYVDDSSPAYISVCIKEFIADLPRSHGSYNNSTGYGTPKMTSLVEPAPYTVRSDYEGWTDVTVAMTSNTAPSPYVVSGTSSLTNCYKVFDHTSSYWKASEELPQSISFDFGSQYQVEEYRFKIRNSSSRNPPKDFGLYGSNETNPDITDETAWTELHTYYNMPDFGAGSYIPWLSLDSPGLYRYYKLKIANVHYPETDLFVDLDEIEFSTGLDESWKAFTQTVTNSADCWVSDESPTVSGGVSIMFGCGSQGKVFNKYMLQARNHSGSDERAFPKNWTLQAAPLSTESPDVNDDSDWFTLDTRTGVSDPGQSNWSSEFEFENSSAYKFYRLNITDRNGSAFYTTIGNIKFIEASRFSTYKQSAWSCYTPTQSGSYYSIVFEPPIGLEGARLFYGSSSGSTVSGFEMLSYDSETIITASGIVDGAEYFKFSFTSSEPKIVDIKNYMDGSAEPYLQVKYTNVYDIDRNIFISPDYATAYDTEDATWIGQDTGYIVPEAHPLWLGSCSGTYETSRTIRLVDTAVSGYWLSPVIDAGNYPALAYLYGVGDITTEVRCSEASPAEAVFLIITTNNDHRNLMYEHKRIVLDSNGEIISRVECDLDTHTDSKVWREADQSFTETELRYHGSVNNRGTAAFMSPGITTCGDVDFAQEVLDYSKWYNFSYCKMDDDTYWNWGPTVSGIKWGEEQSVVYTKTFPVEGSEGFFVGTILSSTDQAEEDRIVVTLAFQDEQETRFSMPMITVFNTRFTGDDYYEIIADVANNGWWVYLGGDVGRIYKIDPGSFTSIKIFGAGDLTNEVTEDDDIYYGYLYYLSISSSLKHLVSIPNPLYSGFWAFTDTTVYLYDEVYNLDDPSIVILNSYTAGTIIEDAFTELHHGACDAEGNLWIVDIDQERVMRINLQRSLRNDTLAIDYDNIVSGAVAVWPHPTNGSCYVLTTDEKDHPDQDIIRMVNAGQATGSRGKFVCEVPGFCSSDHKYGISFLRERLLMVL
jgi:hypothetical protein